MRETGLFVKPRSPEHTMEGFRSVLQITIIKCCIDGRNQSADEEELDGPDSDRRHHLKIEHILPISGLSPGEDIG